MNAITKIRISFRRVLPSGVEAPDIGIVETPLSYRDWMREFHREGWAEARLAYVGAPILIPWHAHLCAEPIGAAAED